MMFIPHLILKSCVEHFRKLQGSYKELVSLIEGHPPLPAGITRVHQIH